MLRTCSLIALVLLSAAVMGQSNFEGRISYMLVSPDSMIQAGLDAWFTKDKIRLEVRPLKKPESMDLSPETIILNFKDGTIDRFKYDRKLVEREPMTGKGAKKDIPALQCTDSTRIIAGYTCHAFSSGVFSKEEIKDSVLQRAEGEVTIWYADKLRYAVPDSLKPVQMIPLLTNGLVALGSSIRIKQGPADLYLRTVATAFYPAKKRLAQYLFNYPPGFNVIYND